MIIQGAVLPHHLRSGAGSLEPMVKVSLVAKVALITTALTGLAGMGCERDSQYATSEALFWQVGGGAGVRGSMGLRVGADTPHSWTHQLGPFVLKWLGPVPGDERLEIWHQDRRTGPIWSTRPGAPFVLVGQGDLKVHEARGSFVIRDRLRWTCRTQVVEHVQLKENEVSLEGGFLDHPCSGVRWSLRWSLEDRQRLHWIAEGTAVGRDGPNRLGLSYALTPEVGVYGMGMQYTDWDQRGRMVPILTQEQGIGRGLEPLSWAVDLFYGKGVAGRSWTSYGAVPHYVTGDLQSFYLDTKDYAVFDFRRPGIGEVSGFASLLSGGIIAASTPVEALEVYTRFSGRMAPLPTWVDQGAIVGVQGGTDRVRSIYRRLKEHGVAMSALWIQDWVGRRKTEFGSQLWWNWELDQSHYAGWDDLVRELARDHVKVLTYINPFLVDVREKTGTKRALLTEAESRGYLVKTASGAPYMIPNTTFSAALLDLSNPKARQWIQEVMRDQMLSTGVRGWMADFGEALPFDGVLAAGTAPPWHNHYPEAWAEVNRAALEAAQLWDDALVFSRSAYTRSPGIARLFWLGDQMVTWDGKDGLKTALTGLLSSGLSGFSLNHSDTGGYTTVEHPLLRYRRSRELLQRWTELNAFTAVLRTHEGNIPEANAQIYDDAESMGHFAKFSQVYRALAPYRRQLMAEAAARGAPLVRPLWWQYPEDPVAPRVEDQFLLGERLMIAPVLVPGVSQVRVYLPDDGWMAVTTGQVYPKGHHRVAAPLGRPAVFCRGVDGLREDVEGWCQDLVRILGQP